MYFDRFETRVGMVVVTGNEQGLTHLFIDNNTCTITYNEDTEYAPQQFTEVKKQLNEFLCGTRQEFDLKLAPEGTEFQNRVWKALTEIPYGLSCSYKVIAEKIGNPKGSRAVGMANNKNPIPIIIPCHRVVGANGKLTGYAFGLAVKQQLLHLELINTVFEQLKQYYGRFSWWQAGSAYEVMVGAVLTQNTNWKNVEIVLKNLEGRLSPEQIECMPDTELGDLIRPSGFYNQKRLRLKALTRWFKQYGYDIKNVRNIDKDTLRAELLAISGIGPETADSILVYAVGKPSFVIDVYTRRIFSRIGLEVPDHYELFQQMIVRALPENTEIFAYYHALLVEHAKRFCNTKPVCDGCPVQKQCVTGQKL